MVLDEVERWYLDVAKADPATAELVTAAIDKLAEDGPSLGRPLVDRIKGSKRHNLKELRPGSSGSSEVRVLFIFDPERQAVLLVAETSRAPGRSGTDRTFQRPKPVMNGGWPVSTTMRGRDDDDGQELVAGAC